MRYADNTEKDGRTRIIPTQKNYKLKRHHHRHGREVQLHVLGKKGEAYFEKQGIPIARKYPRIDEESTFNDCATVVQRFMHEYAVDNASRVEVIYTRYYTRVVHIPKIKSLIPMIPDKDDIEGHKIKKKLSRS